MRTTLDLDGELLGKAQEETGLPTKKAVIEAGLRLILKDASRRRLIALTGSMPDAWAAPRRRSR